MLTPNGGVFGRNPKFNNVTVDGNLTVNGDIALGDDITIADTLTVNGAAAFNGGMTVRPNAQAPTSNIAIGASAGLALNSVATDNVAVGQGALDVIVASTNNIAIGTNSLGAFPSGAIQITNTTPGTGGASSGNITGVVLEKDSGTGIMAVYPTITATMNSGAVSAITITSFGSGATVRSGIVFRAASPVPAGFPTDWRGTLANITGRMTAIGHNALRFHTGTTEGSECTAIGWDTLQAATTATNCTCVGEGAGRVISTGGGNTALGGRALYQTTTGASNTAVGFGALRVNQTSSSNTAVGNGALRDVTTGGNTAIGALAGLDSTASGVNNAGTNSIFVGQDARPNGQSDANTIVIGQAGRGDGSNTTVINNSSCTSTRFAGTASSVLRTSGNTLRIDNARTPATAGAAGNAGDICWDADYIYVCVAANTWKRVAIATWP